MTIGIYLLRFNNTSKVYIGQSLNLETRLNRHIYRVKTGTGSKKLTQAFIDFGEPMLEVIVECQPHELDTLETEAITLWSSVENGFNSVYSMVKSSLFGQDNPNAKYSNEQITDAFLLLVDSPNLTHTKIADICGISSSMVGHISCGESHKWLEKEFPEKYVKLLELKNTRNNKPNKRTQK